MTIDILVIPIVGLAGLYVFKYLRRSVSSSGGCNCEGCSSAKDCPSAGKEIMPKNYDLENDKK